MILVAVLDWGLGHAARSVPLIRALQKQGAEVILAGSGRAGRLLRQECPDLPYRECPAYGVRYPGRNMYFNMFRQLPKILLAIVREHYWLRQLVRQQQIDALVSDSRLGCFHPRIPSVLLTHQLRLLLKPAWLSLLVNGCYQRLLRCFDQIWVPDQPGGLSGHLSFPSPFPATCYVGLLSRMQPAPAPAAGYDLVALLSGPEPQRTLLENRLLDQLHRLAPLRVLIIRGKTEQPQEVLPVSDTIFVAGHLSGRPLRQTLAEAGVVLCRSGYSSLMDLCRLGSKAILIPTPGQPEQLYLARRCREMGWAVVCDQDELDVERALNEAGQLRGGIFPEAAWDAAPLAAAVRKLLTTAATGQK